MRSIRVVLDNFILSDFLKMRVHLRKLFSGLRLVLLMASLALVWMLNSSWNWKTKMVTIMNLKNEFQLEGGYEYTIRPIANVNYHQLWKKCHQTINKKSIYKPTTDIEEVIDALRHAKIIKADIYSPSTASAYKWMLTLEGGQKVLFKPAFTNKTVKESVKCVSGCEHPEYEVAGFALNRILQLGNMPYATGRHVSWDKEITSVATEALRTSVTVQEGGDVCITWNCYLKHKSRYCFEKGVIRGAVIYWISRGTVVQRVTRKGSFHHEFHFMGGFQEIFGPILPGNRTFCDRVKTMQPYKTNWFSFGYLLDMAVIDFLMLNYDGGKHTYIVNRKERLYMDIMIDYGLSFCDREDPVLLAPIYQCCNIRQNLYKNLLKYSANLTKVFDDATKDDPLYPLLLPRDITAMHQRLNTIIAIVQICLKTYGETGVFV
ncbi:hypothetical protein ACJMK2_018361 [Sinanodonta woodiana]|uniref:FAM20 C-terminal domain-containing protein n=1 Tax=Sinanodonta woodiana TaxID=1069815 RepID=A0ABD3UET3_SINWO